MSTPQTNFLAKELPSRKFIQNLGLTVMGFALLAPFISFQNQSSNVLNQFFAGLLRNHFQNRPQTLQRAVTDRCRHIEEQGTESTLGRISVGNEPFLEVEVPMGTPFKKLRPGRVGTPCLSGLDQFSDALVEPIPVILRKNHRGLLVNLLSGILVIADVGGRGGNVCISSHKTNIDQSLGKVNPSIKSVYKAKDTMIRLAVIVLIVGGVTLSQTLKIGNLGSRLHRFLDTPNQKGEVRRRHEGR